MPNVTAGNTRFSDLITFFHTLLHVRNNFIKPLQIICLGNSVEMKSKPLLPFMVNQVPTFFQLPEKNVLDPIGPYTSTNQAKIINKHTS